MNARPGRRLSQAPTRLSGALIASCIEAETKRLGQDESARPGPARRFPEGVAVQPGCNLPVAASAQRLVSSRHCRRSPTATRWKQARAKRG